jgi:hypothetical protein
MHERIQGLIVRFQLHVREAITKSVNPTLPRRVVRQYPLMGKLLVNARQNPGHSAINTAQPKLKPDTCKQHVGPPMSLLLRRQCDGFLNCLRKALRLRHATYEALFLIQRSR